MARFFIAFVASHVGPSTDTSHVGPSRFAEVQRRTEARAALVGLGWKPRTASDAVDAALGALGPETSLERLIFDALRRCA